MQLDQLEKLERYIPLGGYENLHPLVQQMLYYSVLMWVPFHEKRMQLLKQWYQWDLPSSPLDEQVDWLSEWIGQALDAKSVIVSEQKGFSVLAFNNQYCSGTLKIKRVKKRWDVAEVIFDQSKGFLMFDHINLLLDGYQWGVDQQMKTLQASYKKSQNNSISVHWHISEVQLYLEKIQMIGFLSNYLIATGFVHPVIEKLIDVRHFEPYLKQWLPISAKDLNIDLINVNAGTVRLRKPADVLNGLDLTKAMAGFEKQWHTVHKSLIEYSALTQALNMPTQSADKKWQAL